MTPHDVFTFYGSRKAAADALGISRSAVYQWAEFVPELTALRLDRMTAGRLRYDPALYALHKRTPVRKANAYNKPVQRA
jgi:hypothetical protein